MRLFFIRVVYLTPSDFKGPTTTSFVLDGIPSEPIKNLKKPGLRDKELASVIGGIL